MNRIFGIFLVCVLIGGSVSAFEIEGFPFTLRANEVDYDEKTKNIRAYGNVVITQNNFVLASESFFYDAVKHRLVLEDPIVLKDDSGRFVKADSFLYDFESDTGQVSSVNAYVDGIYFTGRSLETAPTSSVLYDATFTSCDKDHPHYHTKANRITLYPQVGDMVAKENLAYLYGTPFFYVPTYIYTQDNTQAHQSIPQAGSNPVDGAFGEYNYAYYFSPKSSGSLSAGYSSDRGVNAGIRHRFLMTPKDRVFLKARYYDKDGWVGGGTYERELFNFTSANQAQGNGVFNRLFDPFTNSDSSRGVLSLSALHQEQVNYRLVDYKPLVSFNIYDVLLPLGLALNTEISAARIKDSPVETTRTGLETTVDRRFSLTRQSYFGLGSNYSQYNYGTGDSWKRLMGSVSLGVSTPTFKPEISYTNLIKQAGRSAFEFDQVSSIQGDEIGLSLETIAFGASFFVDLNYDLDAEDMRQESYRIGLRQHCWMLYVGYDFTFEAFSVGVTLITNDDR